MIEPTSTQVENRGRSRAALRSLTARHALGLGLNFVGGVIIARVLGPRDWGLYGLALVTLAIAQQVVERGAAGFIIQRQRPLSAAETGTVLSIQVVSGMVAAAVIALIAPPLSRGTGDARLVALFGAVGIASAFYSLRAVPLGLLERDLRYARVAVVELVDILAFNVIAVLGVAFGVGVLALPVAFLGRSGVSLVAGLALSGIRWRVAFSMGVLREFVHFALPYSASNALTFVNTAAAPIVVGGLVGISEFGVVQLAYTIIVYPQALTTIITRVGFATYSRTGPSALAETVSRSTSRLLRAAGGATLLLAATSVLWIEPIYGPAWRDMSKYMLVIAPVYALGANLSLVIASLNVVGHAPRVFLLSAAFSILYWGLSFPLVSLLGGLGLPTAYALATAVFCGYLALARSSLGPLTIRSALAEYAGMCLVTLGFVILYVSLASPFLLVTACALMVIWVASRVDIRAIGQVVAAPFHSPR